MIKPFTKQKGLLRPDKFFIWNNLYYNIKDASTCKTYFSTDSMDNRWAKKQNGKTVKLFKCPKFGVQTE